MALDVAAPAAAATAIGTARAEATVVRFSFPPELEADRQEAIRLLQGLPQNVQDFERALRLIDELRRDPPVRRGHNGPPEEIDALPPAEEIVTEATVAADALLTELTADQPHLSSIKLGERALRRVAGWLGTAIAWVAGKADLFSCEFVKALGKTTAVGVGVEVATHLDKVKATIDTILPYLDHLLARLP